MQNANIFSLSALQPLVWLLRRVRLWAWKSQKCKH